MRKALSAHIVRGPITGDIYVLARFDPNKSIDTHRAMPVGSLDEALRFSRTIMGLDEPTRMDA